MASLKSGAISSSRNPAIPQPIRVTRNVSRLCSFAKRMKSSTYGLMVSKGQSYNDLLKNTAKIVHSRHRSVGNFIMNLISSLGAYCFFENKPKALQEKSMRG